MAKESKILRYARENGLVDDRELILAADIFASNGNNGRAWMFLNGSTLHLYELIFPAGLGLPMESLELKGSEVVKASSFVLNPSLTLRCAGVTYHFKGFAQAKRFIEAVREGCGT